MCLRPPKGVICMFLLGYTSTGGARFVSNGQPYTGKFAKSAVEEDLLHQSEIDFKLYR